MLFASLGLLALANIPASFAAPAAQTCVNPEVHYEWRSLSKQHKKEFLDAVVCMTKLPASGNLVRTYPVSVQTPEINPNASAYDDFVYIHADLNRTYRGTALIFAWHRWFNDKFEKALKEKCGFKGTIPYWDWTRDAQDFEHSDFFDDDPEYGIGGWGDRNNDITITTGAWKDVVLNYPTRHQIRRNYTYQPWLTFPVNGQYPDPFRTSISTFSPQKVDWIYENCHDGDYQCFQSHAEGSAQIGGGFHTVLGGDMGGMCSGTSNSSNCVYGAFYTVNDPTFWFHHSNLDRLWDTWQRKSDANAKAFYGGLTQNDSAILEFPLGQPPNATLDTVLQSDSLFGPQKDTVRDVLSTTGGFLCYVYDHPAGSPSTWSTNV